MSNYDVRQHKEMLHRIRWFEKGAGNLTRLGLLINDLNALLAHLETTEKTWKDAFRNQWSIIEELYAVALDRGEKGLSTEDQRLLENAIAKMKELLGRRPD